MKFFDSCGDQLKPFKPLPKKIFFFFFPIKDEEGRWCCAGGKILG